MNKITSFDRPTLKALRGVLEAALKPVEAQYGISVDVGNASFTPENVTFKVNLAVVGGTGEVMTKEATAFKQLASFYGLDPNFLFKKFTNSNAPNDEYKVLGLKTGRGKYPIVAERVRDGKQFKFQESALKSPSVTWQD